MGRSGDSARGDTAAPGLRRVALVVGALAAAAGVVLGVNCVRQSLAPAPARAGWYDPAPLYASLRPEARAGLAAAAGVERADELTLYDLDIDLDPDRGAFSLREAVWLTQREAEPLGEIELRLDANVGAELSPDHGPPPLTFARGTCAAPHACTASAPSPSLIRIIPDHPLARGERLKIELVLAGKLEAIDASRTNVIAQAMEGLGSIASGESRGDYGLLAVGDGIVSLGNFYAALGRRKDGKWVGSPRTAMGDLGPDAVSHVRARIRGPADLSIASTGIEIAPPRVEPDGRRTVEVGAAGVRDFAILAGRTLESRTRDVGGVTVRSHHLAAERAAGERVVDVAARALEVFERRFGAYPYVDLDVVEAPLVGGAGGVEFSGLVTVASMLYRPPDVGGALGIFAAVLGAGGADGPLAQIQPMLDSMLEFTVAHEVAHQFWHGLVGSDSREHPYLDEALAQYSAVLYLEERYGAERAAQIGDMQVKANYQMMRVLGSGDGPVDLPVDSFGSQLSYAGLVYGKAPYLYAALRREVGDPAFFAALRAYVDAHRFRIAPPGALVDLLAAGGHDAAVHALARHWLEERHGDDDLGADPSKLFASMLGADAGDLGPILGLLQGMLGGTDLAPPPADAGAPARNDRTDAGKR